MKNFYFSNNLIFFLCGVLREHANANSVRESGDDSCGVPPVPISNTAVKPTYAESTWLEAAWEDRELPVRLTLMRCMSVFLVEKTVKVFEPQRTLRTQRKNYKINFLFFESLWFNHLVIYPNAYVEFQNGIKFLK